MKLALTIGLFAASLASHAQIADLAWVKHLKGTTITNGSDAATSVVLDDDGNVYVAGSFFGTFDLNPGVLTNSVTSAGDRDIFVVKLDAMGNYIWGKRIGGSGIDAAYDMAIDGSGNLLITGHFIGTVDFDPNGGTANMVGNAVNSNGYIWKLTGDGVYQWAKYWGSSAHGNGVDATENGDVYVAGAFEGVANGVGNQLALGLTSLGDKDACFFKLNSTGVLQWAGRIGGAPESDYAFSIAATNDGVLIAGYFFPGGFGSVVDFNPGPGTVNRQGNGITDAYVLKLDTDGTYMWVNIHGGLDYDDAQSIEVDSNGNYWLTGSFRMTMDADPGAGVSNLVSAGNDDAFLAKYSPTGAHLWSGRMGGTDVDNGLELVVGADDAVYMTGTFRGQADLNPTTGTTTVSSFGSSDMHITKLFANGTFDWVRRFGGSSADVIAGLAVDHFGAVHAAGYFTGSADMDPNGGQLLLDTQNLGQTDGFVLKLRQCVPSSSSITVSACESYTIGDETFVDSGVYPVLLTSSTGCDSTVTVTLTITTATTSTTTVQHCGAYTWNGQNYNVSGTYTAALTNAAGCDSTATLHLTIGQPSVSTTTLQHCGAYTWNGQTYNASGTYTATLTNAAGCDSTATLHLTVGQANSSTTTLQHCGAYTWNGQTHGASGTYAAVLTNAAGCDSTATLQLTVVQPSTSSTTLQHCGGYTWNSQTYNASGTYTAAFTNAAGCDSTATLHLTVGQPSSSNTVVSACGAYTWNGQTYSANGTYSVSLTNAAGCDSTATLQLTITEVDDLVEMDGVVLTALQSGGTYQWVNCNGNVPIPGATQQSYTAIANGQYAVQITLGACTVQSDCFAVISTGVEGRTAESLTIYPVPAHDHVIIDGLNGSGTIEILDAQGRMVTSVRIGSPRVVVPLTGIAPGTYLLRTRGVSSTSTWRVIVE